MQVGYGATIASFLGGVHWGAAMLDARRECHSLCYSSSSVATGGAVE